MENNNPSHADYSRFLENLQPGQIVTDLMDMLVDTLFYIKDLDGAYIFVNKVFRDTLLHSGESIIGKTDFDLFGGSLAKQYREDDLKVLNQEAQIREKTELVTYRPGVVKWYVTTKTALRDKDGNVIGLAGLTRPSKGHANASVGGPMGALSKAVEFIYDNKTSALSIDAISEASGTSISTLERSFKKHFKCSPGKFVTQVKISAACELLADPTYSINEVCHEMGYSDPVVFSRVFKREMKITPSAYRQSLPQNKQK